MSETATSPERKLVIFAVDGDPFALPVERVREIVRYSTPRSIVSPDPAVVGVVALRGQLLAVVSLARRLGLAEQPVGQETRIIVVDDEQAPFGLLVDAVDAVVTLDEGALEAPPEVAPEHVIAMVQRGEGLVLVLEPGLQASTADPDAVVGVDAPPRLEVAA